MKRNERYMKAVLERKVPTSVLIEQAQLLKGKSEQEQNDLREKWAEEILEKYPMKQTRQM